MIAVLALAACGGSGGTTTTSSTSTSPSGGESTTAAETTQISPRSLVEAASPSDAELEEGAGANWPIVGGDLGNSRYSTLEEIDTENVSKLHLVWQGSYSPKMDAVAMEEESNPLEVNGVMFLITPEDNAVAVDATTGKKLWEWKAEVTEEESRTQPPTGVQGLAVGDGMVFLETNAAKVVGIDVKSGEEVWSETVALGETRLESPSTPTYFDGVVYVGVSGAESARGHVDAFDAKSGKLLWRTFITCGANETPPADGQCPKGKGNPNEGGGSIWTYPAIDSKDGLLYVTTANPSSAAEVNGDFKWTTSIVALDMKTGAIKWGFQGVHHDLWDYDCTTPPVLFENEFGGHAKQVANFVCKTDLHFELEQATGKPVLPVKEEPVPTAAAGKTPDVAAQKKLAAAETQPVPMNSDKSEVVPRCANEKLLPNPAPDGSKFVYSCTFAAPGSKRFIAYGIGSGGGQDGKTPLAYDPQTDDMYYCEEVSVEAKKIGELAGGGSSLGVNNGWQGSIAAVDVTDNTIKWLHKTIAPEGSCRGGSTATAGGIVFSSANHGKLFAFDAETGKVLWTFQGPSSLYAAPIVYEAGGHEYVAVYYGGQVPLVGGMTNEHYARMLVFSIEGATQPSAAQMPKSEFSTTEEETLKLAAEGKISPQEQAEAFGKIIEEDFEQAGGAGEGAEQIKEAEEEQSPAEAKIANGPGKAIFSTNCGSCHTLAAAGTSGTVGPNLDQIKPGESEVERQVINGGGGMPAFGKEKILSPKEIDQVSEYVATVAGG
ncbi:MAG TPA: PQQ-binding-like beta-propeller repeat protein [Solirubrobacterales bacterium]|nr:PQQ-binding-like beta-propeller repeat protein [Solirubrobacterales bacterium]